MAGCPFKWNCGLVFRERVELFGKRTRPPDLQFSGGPGNIRNDNVVPFVTILLSVFLVGFGGFGQGLIGVAAGQN